MEQHTRKTDRFKKQLFVLLIILISISCKVGLRKRETKVIREQNISSSYENYFHNGRWSVLNLRENQVFDLVTKEYLFKTYRAGTYSRKGDTLKLNYFNNYEYTGYESYGVVDSFGFIIKIPAIDSLTVYKEHKLIFLKGGEKRFGNEH